MAKRKIQSSISVADGAGGMAPLTDLRFDTAGWPIHLNVQAGVADDWFAHLEAECGERGWSSGGLSQQDADENSGTRVVNTGAAGQSPALEIVWERPRGGPIAIRARPAGNPAMPLEVAKGFLDGVGGRCQEGKKVGLHRRAHLIYDGLPWRGEFWLGKDLRLGPPSKHASWLVAPQIIIVDAMVEGIGGQGVNSAFDLLLRELSIFLNVVVGIRAAVEKGGWAWTHKIDETGKLTESALSMLGYWEATACIGMPKAGEVPLVPLLAVQRPGLERLGISMEDVEQAVPQDTLDLWQKFAGLPVEQRDHFLKAGNAFQIARAMWPDQRTAYVAFMVVACEALKPVGRRNDLYNIYDVVEGLLGTSESEQLQQLRFAPQKLRSNHLHRGELVAGELVPILLQSHFGDPSFGETASSLTRVTRTCLIEWLRRDGKYTLKHSLAQSNRKK